MFVFFMKMYMIIVIFLFLHYVRLLMRSSCFMKDKTKEFHQIIYTHKNHPRITHKHTKKEVSNLDRLTIFKPF